MMILIDANSVCHMAKHSMGDLSWEEKRVGVIFGFIRQLLSLSKKFGTNRFVFAWDSRSSVRTNFFPEYKSGRRKEKTEEEKELDDLAYAQFNLLRDTIIPELGFVDNFWQEGFEADDVIASVVKHNSLEKIVIVSTDEDLYQLLSENVTLYSIKKKQEYTHNNLWKDFHVTPKEWSEVKAIAGCSSDSIPGIPGVGEKTACKYLNRLLPITTKSYRSIKENKALISRNLKLTTLPYPDTKTFLVITESHPVLRLRAFLDVCTRYGFESFMYKDSLAQWKEHIFQG